MVLSCSTESVPGEDVPGREELMANDFEGGSDWDDICTCADVLRDMRADATPPLDWNEWFGGGLDGDVVDLLSQLLCFSPAHRPTAAEALQHPVFTADSSFMEEIRLMDVYVGPDAFWPKYTPPLETNLRELLHTLQSEQGPQGGGGCNAVDSFYLHRKKVVGKMLVSRLVIPADVEDARRTLYFRKKNAGTLMRRGSSMRELPSSPGMTRCMTAAAFPHCNSISNMCDLPRSKSIVTLTSGTLTGEVL